MATQPIEGSAVAAFSTMPPMPAVARILARFERVQLAGFVAVALDLIDTMDGDPDDEDNADREASDGDDRDQAHPEWSSLRATQRRAPHNILAGEEDDEDDDPDTGVEDGPRGFDPETDFGAEELGEREDCAPGECSDPIARSEQRERIRQTRCNKIVYHNSWHGYGGGQQVEYRLREQGPIDPV